jgi:hypothetical protein
LLRPRKGPYDKNVGRMEEVSEAPRAAPDRDPAKKKTGEFWAQRELRLLPELLWFSGLSSWQSRSFFSLYQAIYRTLTILGLLPRFPSVVASMSKAEVVCMIVAAVVMVSHLVPHRS